MRGRGTWLSGGKVFGTGGGRVSIRARGGNMLSVFEERGGAREAQVDCHFASCDPESLYESATF